MSPEFVFFVKGKDESVSRRVQSSLSRLRGVERVRLVGELTRSLASNPYKVPQDLQGDDWLSKSDVASILRINERTVQRWVSRRELKGVRRGKVLRINRSELDRFIEANMTA